MRAEGTSTHGEGQQLGDESLRLDVLGMVAP